MAADERGDIGYWHPGLHPLRPKGYDERLPYPGTGEAEWRGLLDRRKTPHVINPRQGYLFNWNNVPSAGWTSGDSEATERLAGPYHRSVFLSRLVARVAQEAQLRGVARHRPHQRQHRPAAAAVRQAPQARPQGRDRRRRVRAGHAAGLGRQLHPHRLPRHGARRGGHLGGVQGPRRGHRPVRADQAVARAGHRVAGRQARHLARVRHLQRRGLRAAHPVPRRPAAGRRAHPGRAGQALRQRRPRPPGASRGACTTSRSRARPTSPSCRSSTAAPGSSRSASVPDRIRRP